MQMASNVGDAQMSSAAARASGYVGGANALTQGLGTYVNYQQNQNLLNAMQPNPTFNVGQNAGGYNYTYRNPSEVGPFQS